MVKALFSLVAVLAAFLLTCHACLDEEARSLLLFKKKMLDFKNAFFMKASNHFFRTWKEGSDCCESWERVVCNPLTHHVQSLDFSDDVVAIQDCETLLPLSNLQGLTSLNMEFNSFNVSLVLACLGRFPSLREINLTCNYYGSSISSAFQEWPSEALQRLSRVLNAQMPYVRWWHPRDFISTLFLHKNLKIKGSFVFKSIWKVWHKFNCSKVMINDAPSLTSLCDMDFWWSNFIKVEDAYIGDYFPVAAKCLYKSGVSCMNDIIDASTGMFLSWHDAMQNFNLPAHICNDYHQIIIVLENFCHHTVFSQKRLFDCYSFSDGTELSSFSVKKGYALFFDCNKIYSDLARRWQAGDGALWKSRLGRINNFKWSPKLYFFMWCLILRGLPVGERIKYFNRDLRCVFCESEDSFLHFFFDCGVIRDLWRHIFCLCGIDMQSFNIECIIFGDNPANCSCPLVLWHKIRVVALFHIWKLKSKIRFKYLPHGDSYIWHYLSEVGNIVFELKFQISCHIRKIQFLAAHSMVQNAHKSQVLQKELRLIEDMFSHWAKSQSGILSD